MSFSLTYLFQELRRRFGRTLLTALGLASGVGLVIAITGVSDGLERAQDDALVPLRSVGTDIMVTRVVAQAQEGSDGGGAIGGFFAGPSGQGGLNNQDAAQALQENTTGLLTNLAELGDPGEKFTQDFFLPATLLTFPQESIEEISSVDGVTSVSGGLSLTATHQEGIVPEIVAEFRTEAETFTETLVPDPLTDAEQQEVRACVAEQGGPGPGPGGGAPPGERPRGRLEDCLPDRFRQSIASIRVPARVLQQVLDPPSTDITSTTYTAGGVDVSRPDQGLITRSQITEGTYFTEDGKGELIANVAYANTKDLKVGDEIVINEKTFTIVGLASPTLTGNTSDVYLSLSELQVLASKQDRVNVVLVKTDDAASVETIAAEISKKLPGAQVVTAQTLADQVTGSLADAKNLADRFGSYLAAIVLIGAFVIAALLTLSTIAKRVREIGTLRAIGWSKFSVVRQILLETTSIGIVGGALGIGIGYLVGWAITTLAPPLTATAPVLPGAGSSELSGIFGIEVTQAVSRTIEFAVPLEWETLALGAGLALLGGLLAGLIGGWRAARLQPAVALRDVG